MVLVSVSPSQLPPRDTAAVPKLLQCGLGSGNRNRFLRVLIHRIASGSKDYWDMWPNCLIALFRCRIPWQDALDPEREVNSLRRGGIWLSFEEDHVSHFGYFFFGWRFGLVITALVASTKLLYVEPGYVLRWWPIAGMPS